MPDIKYHTGGGTLITYIYFRDKFEIHAHLGTLTYANTHPYDVCRVTAANNKQQG